MKKFLFAIIAFAAVFSFAACDDTETYAEQRDRERDSIAAFIRNEHITVIAENQFKERYNSGVTVTDTAKNEYVLIESNGVYMQIVDMGCGETIKDGETAYVLVRFDEYNLGTRALICDDSWQLSNNVTYYSPNPEKLTITNTSGTFEGTFDSSSLMYSTYSSSAVPTGWLEPFTYIKVGRPKDSSEKIAHVRLIVPHTYGTYTASSSVYACYYDLYIQRGR